MSENLYYWWSDIEEMLPTRLTRKIRAFDRVGREVNIKATISKAINIIAPPSIKATCNIDKKIIGLSF